MLVKKATETGLIEDQNTVNTFDSWNLNPILKENIVKKGYQKPTPIQDQAIGAVLEGKDILGMADTGTGKTAAFAIPLIERILTNSNERILILAPTRELAMQIKQEFRSFTPGLKVYIALAIGGSNIREQIVDIKRDPHLVIGTPGRLIDLGKRGIINFAKYQTVVIDEVDRMLDMGFIEDIKSILERTPSDHQNIFFSATVKKKMEELIDTFLKDPVKVAVATENRTSRIEQDIVKVKRQEKEEVLCRLLKDQEFKKVLVFGATKMMVEKLSVTLAGRGFKAGAIHGDKAQHQRRQVIRLYQENQINILVATDVAARGLDIKDITHVINYDMPNTYEDYIHRIGRTGRANAKGFALTFVE
jgi:superfamily II DNA/RNA helicase